MEGNLFHRLHFFFIKYGKKYMLHILYFSNEYHSAILPVNKMFPVTQDLDGVEINALSDFLLAGDNTAIAMPEIPVNATSKKICNITLCQVDDLGLHFEMEDGSISVENSQNQTSQNEFSWNNGLPTVRPYHD